MQLDTLIKQYHDELQERVLPFWLEHSQDKEFGGYFTCLDRDGSVFDTDKFMWLQGREVWLFSMLCNKEGIRPEWLECARQGAEFMLKHGHDGDYNWYFALTREGQPLVDPYNIFSYTFAAMAFAQLHKATDEERYAEATRRTFQHIMERWDNPKAQWNKAHAGTRNIRAMAPSMILCNLLLEIEHLIEPEVVEASIDRALSDVMENFYRPELGLVVEHINADGTLSDTFDGRLINPGHTLETMWFVMDLARRRGDEELIKKAVQIGLDTLEFGWDKEHGGIFYFMDRKGCPPQQLEWDQKLWWVHIESTIAMLEGYLLTGDERCKVWFEKLHDYTWSHFRDAEYPEWYGYLNRRGEVLLTLKGGKWKGCFHVPRGLYKCECLLRELKQKMEK
ncbi:MAG: AGE family epimerase/isomerase [Alistipes sp.]|nr:AGE family epimerase/isomerase [Alistipes sp.]